jgi:hypothetical protein
VIFKNRTGAKSLKNMRATANEIRKHLSGTGRVTPIPDMSTDVYQNIVSLANFGVVQEVAGVAVVSPEAQRLARRLRQLRLDEWPDARLTQAKLAKAFSAEEALQAATVSSWESATAPKLPPRHRLQAYARFFATQRSLDGASPRLLPLKALTPGELESYKKLEMELLGLRSSLVAERFWHFTDDGPVTLVCAQLPPDQTGPLAEPTNPNYTELHHYADADALIELHGHIRAENPNMAVHFMIPSDVGHDDLTGHIILVGGVVWNEITGRLSNMAKLPVKQVEHPDLDSGEIFVAENEGTEQEFWPEWADAGKTLLSEDVGLLARVPNPLNSSRTLTICNGIHSRGVYGAVRTLTDTHLRDPNERYIAASFGDAPSFAILMSVQVIKNKTITPDFSSNGVVLFKWSQDTVAGDPA